MSSSMMISDNEIAERVANYNMKLITSGVEQYAALQLTMSFQAVLCAERAQLPIPFLHQSRGDYDTDNTGSPAK